MTAPAETLRAAVTRLRCEHLHPVQPPEGSLAKPGDCRMCGAPFNPEFVNGIERVAEPLASWLAGVAERHNDAVYPGRCQWCVEPWPCPDLREALAFARSILGRQS